MRKAVIFVIPFIAAVIMLVILKTVLFIGYVPSTSMEPTLKQDSIVIGIRRYRQLQKRDIVVFKHDGKLLVKRIAGVGGEHIKLYNRIYVVPEGHYLMLGDNAEDSFDSRYWSNPYVPEKDIVAKILNE